MAEFPYMPFYPMDWMNDTFDLSAEGYRSYHILLCVMWMNTSCSLPNDRAVLMRRCGIGSGTKWTKIWGEIEGFFEEKGGLLHSVRLTTERGNSRVRREAYSRAGMAGAKAKWRKTKDQGDGDANDDANDEKHGDANGSHSYRDTVETVSPLGAVPKKMNGSRRSPQHALPDEFVPKLEAAKRLMDDLDLTRSEMNYCFQGMKDHAQATDRRQRDWNAAFNNWVRKAAHDHDIGPGSRNRKAARQAGSAIDDA